MIEINTITIIALCLMSFISGGFGGYFVGRHKGYANTDVSMIQLFGMILVLLYFTASIAMLTELNEVTLGILLAFVGGEVVGDKIKCLRGMKK